MQMLKLQTMYKQKMFGYMAFAVSFKYFLELQLTFDLKLDMEQKATLLIGCTILLPWSLFLYQILALGFFHRHEKLI
jgi:hypothetical protein